MFSLLSSLINLGTSYFSKKQDVDLEKYKVKGTVDVEAIRSDTEITKALAELAAVRKDDPTDRWGRRLIIYPVGLWIAVTFYDSTFRNLIPDYTWRTLALPENLDYIPYAVIAYLLVYVLRKKP